MENMNPKCDSVSTPNEELAVFLAYWAKLNIGWAPSDAERLAALAARVQRELGDMCYSELEKALEETA